MPSGSVLGNRAVVIGAGVGGLFAAGAMRGHFREIILLEKDPLPASPEFRMGVPQGPHGHAVLKRGENIAESLFPGFREALIKAGGVPLDMDKDAIRYESGRWSSPANTDLTIYSQTRALLEHVLRQCALANGEITIRQGARVSGMILSNGIVRGVNLDMGGGAVESLQADLVVDASGRSSTTPQWLEDNGFGEVPSERLGINLCYVTGIFAAAPITDGKPKLCTLRESAPGVRGGTVMPVENNRWMVTLNGRHNDIPPSELDGFLAYAKALPDPVVYERIRNAPIEGRLRRFIIPESYWRHYEKMPVFPGGLIPVGDVIAGFNPVFGQGMTVAAIDAEHLGALLDERAAAGGGLEGLWKDYFPRAAESIGAAWGGTSIYDLQFESTVGVRSDDYPMRLAGFRAMQELAAEDVELRQKQMLVGNMLLPPSSLYTPDILARLQAHMNKAT